MPKKRSVMVSLLLLIALSFVATARGEGSRIGDSKTESQTVELVWASPVSAPREPAQGPTDPAELEAFLDELMAKDMEEHHIAGAVVSVVKDGELFFAKGYGYADLENRIPVDPEQTGFLVGSVTKLFTWTAVMQLVENGKLGLYTDINEYLDFRIPDTYLKPITIKHLLTHTDGFEERYFEFVVMDADDLVPAREWLVSHMPARVRRPGDLAAYSNYGTSLAGYIVARVSGQPYDQYVQDNILDPLGMTHTSVQSPIPPDLRAQATVGYIYEDGAFQSFPEYLAQYATVPASAMQASATDMARFMIAHLQSGRSDEASINSARILKKDTLQQMHRTLYTHDPRLLGTTYGFFEFSDNGQRAIGHRGEAHPINSLLLLLPEQNLGIFVSYNSEGGGDLTNQHLGFQRAFFDHYYSTPAVDPIQSPADFAQRAGRFEGSYRLTESSYTTMEKSMGLFGAVEIRDSGDGALIFTTPWGEWRLVEVEPHYFRQADEPFGFVFRVDEWGRITHMFADYTPMLAFEKLNWYETPGFNIALALGCTLIFLATVLGVSILAVRNRRQSGDRTLSPRGARIARWTILAICVLNLLFMAGTALWFSPKPLFGVSPIFQFVLGLGVMAAVLTAGALVCTILAWKNSYWGVAGRLYHTLVVIAAVAFVWFLNSWNLLGWRF